MDTRTCRKCGETKPLTEFHSDASQPLGKDYACKVCAVKESSEWKKRNVESNRRAVMRWRANNPEKWKAVARASYQRNKAKRQANHRAWRLANLGRMHELSLRHRLGVPIGTYARILAEQDGKCAICGSESPDRTRGRPQRHFHLDHCHDTGDVRGLLCHGCNTGIGSLRHDEQILLAAIRYLSRRSG